LNKASAALFGEIQPFQKRTRISMAVYDSQQSSLPRKQVSIRPKHARQSEDNCQQATTLADLVDRSYHRGARSKYDLGRFSHTAGIAT
jgi:hypothetical protein